MLSRCWLQRALRQAQERQGIRPRAAGRQGGAQMLLMVG